MRSDWNRLELCLLRRGGGGWLGGPGAPARLDAIAVVDVDVDVEDPLVVL